MNNDKIDALISVVEKRPIDMTSEYTFIQPSEINIFKQNSSDVDYLNSSRYTPLKIVLMGEVKAGKSTILNALVGEEISPVGVTETTAVIIEVSYGPSKIGLIDFKNGLQQEYQINEIYRILEENKHNPEYYQTIDRVTFKYPLEALQELKIIDTPGVESITKANQDTTHNYIQKSDVVLWILNADHIGQSDINDQIINIVDYGKPIILVVTRMDGVEGSKEELMDYADGEYGMFVESIFTVSGLEAFIAKQTGNRALLDQSGLPIMLAYLEDNIERGSAEVKEESINSSFLQIYVKELAVCRGVLQSIEFAENELNRLSARTEYYINKISSSLTRKLESKKNQGYLKTEANELSRLIFENSKKLLSSNYTLVKDELIRITSPNFLNDIYEEICKEMHESVYNDLKISMDTLSEELAKNHTAYEENYLENLSQQGNAYLSLIPEDTSADLISGAKQGAIVGGAYGVATAAYSAVLGPSAAYIGLGAALGSVLPPVLIVGAAVGAAFKFVNKEKKTKEIQAEVEQYIKEADEKLNLALGQYVDNLINVAKIALNQNLRLKTEAILKCSTLDEMMLVRNNIQSHMHNLESLNIGRKNELTLK